MLQKTLNRTRWQSAILLESLKKRFDDDFIRDLLELRWWDWPIEEITDFLPILTSTDLNAAKKAVKARLNTKTSQ